MKKKKKLTLKDVMIARDRCAKVIAIHGDKYLPIFERLEHEIEAWEKRQKLLEKALIIYKSNSPKQA